MGEWSPDYFSGDGAATLDDVSAQNTSDPYAAYSGGDELGTGDATQQSYDDTAALGPDVGASTLPGVSPFASGVGFLPDSILANQLQPLIGPGGSMYSTGPLPNLGTSPAVQKGGYGIMPVPSAGALAPGFWRSVAAQLAVAAAKYGLRRITLKAVASMLRRFGPNATSQITGLNAQTLMLIWNRRRGRGRRGPYLRTVVKRIKQGHRYEHLMRRYAAKAHIGHARRAAPAPFHRRRRRRG